VYETIEEAQRAVGFPIRTPSYLPTGATLERVMVQMRASGQVVVLHYRTPSARFSIFQAFKNRPAEFEGKRRRGRPHAQFWQSGDYWFGIVGSLPKARIERIAQSLGAPNQDAPRLDDNTNRAFRIYELPPLLKVPPASRGEPSRAPTWFPLRAGGT
jgi:hypothetical protein